MTWHNMVSLRPWIGLGSDRIRWEMIVWYRMTRQNKLSGRFNQAQEWVALRTRQWKAGQEKTGIRDVLLSD